MVTWHAKRMMLLLLFIASFPHLLSTANQNQAINSCCLESDIFPWKIRSENSWKKFQEKMEDHMTDYKNN